MFRRFSQQYSLNNLLVQTSNMVKSSRGTTQSNNAFIVFDRSVKALLTGQQFPV